jgi:crossover junction endodeoxyribonuclease RusA
MIALTLPWPNAKLNPNRSKGGHWGITAALRKKARADAHFLTGAAMRAAKVAAGAAGPLAVIITFVQPDRRARDRDNLLAAMKPALDGVADALGVNDAQFEPVTLRREYGAKPGAVRIEIGGPA